MLVLSRKQGERIVVGPDIVITVLEVRGNRVRVGIAAPRGMPIHREEVVRALAGDGQDEPAVSSREESPFFAECN